MGTAPINRRSFCLLAGVLLAGAGLGVSMPLWGAGTAFGQSDPTTAAAMEQYRRALDAYNAAHDRYAAVANAYWASITEKRRSRNAKASRRRVRSAGDRGGISRNATGAMPQPTSTASEELKNCWAL